LWGLQRYSQGAERAGGTVADGDADGKVVAFGLEDLIHGEAVLEGVGKLGLG
jgi:hypothetical protein